MKNVLDLRKKKDTLGNSLNSFIKENYHLTAKEIMKK